VLESARAVSRRQASALTKMLTTDVSQIQQNCVERLQFLLADVKAFDCPVVVLPDVVGGGGT
jgi:hypothetical protein